MYCAKREGRALYDVSLGGGRYGFDSYKEAGAGRYQSEFHQYAKREMGKAQL